MVIDHSTTIKIQVAFYQLINTDPTNSPTVIDIIRLANLSRGTFYLHYANVQELENELQISFIEHLKVIFSLNDEKITEKFLLLRLSETFSYILENKMIFTYFLTKKFFNTLWSSFILRLLKNKYDDNHEYYRESIVPIINQLTEIWLKKDSRETPNDFAKIVYYFVSHPLTNIWQNLEELNEIEE